MDDKGTNSLPNIEQAILAIATALNNRLGTTVACRATRTAAQSIPNNATVNITLPTEDFDTHEMHSTATNTERVYARVAGLYQASFHVEWAANTVGRRFTILEKNAPTAATGTRMNFQQSTPATDGRISNDGVALLQMSPGDYVSLCVLQDSGGTLNTGTIGPVYLELLKVGD